jgi:Arc/MetJ-type ribon-helix-helix transcriptional regulator
LSSTLSSLLELARIPGLSKRQRDDAVSLMKELRREGFTNRDLAVLVSNRWKEPTIKGYTRGEKVKSTEERDVVLDTFSRFTSAGKTLQDVEDYLAVKNQLDSQQLSIDTIAYFFINMTSQKFNLTQLTNLYWEIEDLEYTVADISEGLNALRRLELENISIETMKELKEATNRFGGLDDYIKAINTYENIQDLSNAKSLAVDLLYEQHLELKKIESEINETQAQALAIITYMNVAKSLVSQHSFDLFSLNTLMEVAQKYGNPSQILEAINSYKNLGSFKTECEALRIEVKRLEEDRATKEAEILALNRFIEKANRAIGEIEASHKKSLTVQAIAEIVDGTGEIEIDPLRFKQTSLRFLLGINQYAKQHSDILIDWEKLVSFFLKKTIEALTTIQ